MESMSEREFRRNLTNIATNLNAIVKELRRLNETLEHVKLYEQKKEDDLK